MSSNLALDVSLEKARALHRVWRALNDGDCPKCHVFHAATEIVRDPGFISCPNCGFYVFTEEIEEIERMFAPAMNAALNIFEAWRMERRSNDLAKHCEEASKIVATWPEWKRNILRHSSEPTNSVARTPVESKQERQAKGGAE